MANETTTTTANDTVVTVLHGSLIEELRPNVLPYKSFHTQADPVSKGRVVQFADITDPGAAAAINEATDASNTAVATGGVTVTASEQAIMATPTDVLSESSVFDAFQWVRGALARSYAERIGDIFCALYAAFSNVTGSSGTDFTLAQFLAAVSALSGREVNGTYTCVLHPQQVLDLRAGSGNTPGGILPGPAANLTGNEFLGSAAFNQTIMTSVQRRAYIGELFDVDIWATTSVTTANNGADRAGAVFGADAIGWHELRDMRVELQRDASLRASEIVVSGNIGAAELADTKGQSIITDA